MYTQNLPNAEIPTPLLSCQKLSVDAACQRGHERSKLFDDLLKVTGGLGVEARFDTADEFGVHRIPILARRLVYASAQLVGHTDVEPFAFGGRDVLTRTRNFFHGAENTKAHLGAECPQNWGHSTSQIEQSPKRGPAYDGGYRGYRGRRLRPP